MTRTQDKPRETSSSNITGRGDRPANSNSGRRSPPSQMHHAETSATQPDHAAGDALDEGLDETFPGSDPVSATRRVPG